MMPLRRNVLGLWLVALLALASLGTVRLMNVTRGERLHAATERHILRHVQGYQPVQFSERSDPVNGWKNLGTGRWSVWGRIHVGDESWSWSAEVEPPSDRRGQPRVCTLQIGDVLICSNFIRVASDPFRLGALPRDGSH